MNSELNDSAEMIAAQKLKFEAEAHKLESEARSIDQQIAAGRGAKIRAWLVSLSVVTGIVVSAAGAYQSLIEIAFKNRQLGLEAQVKTHELFLNGVLDRMSGIKTLRYEANDKGDLVLNGRDSYGDVIQVGAYGSAVGLACEFENLRLPALSALNFQLASQPKDAAAKNMLERIEKGCPDGWDYLTEKEKAEWVKQAQ